MAEQVNELKQFLGELETDGGYFMDGRVVRSNHMSREEWQLQDFDWRLRHPQHGKYTHPYSYDAFILWEKNKSKGNGSAYDDRMRQWDREKWDKAHKKAYPPKFDGGGPSRRYADPKATQKFLRLYFNDSKLQLIRVIEECNVSNGYPVFCFIYRTGKRKK